jgi:hypothetical protein
MPVVRLYDIQAQGSVADRVGGVARTGSEGVNMTIRRVLRTIIVATLLTLVVGLLGLLWAIYLRKVDIVSYAMRYAAPADQLWQSAEGFLNSVFFTSIVGALAGAFAGAYGGQLIVERGRTREQMLAEIRNANAAIMIAYSICNMLLSLKGQHLKPFKETYDKN